MLKRSHFSELLISRLSVLPRERDNSLKWPRCTKVSGQIKSNALWKYEGEVFFLWQKFTVFLFLRAVVSISIPTLILYMHHSAPFIAPLSGVTYKKFLPTMATIIKWQIFFNFATNYWHATIISLRQTVRRTVNQIKEGKGSWVITSFKNITPKHQRKRLKNIFF